MPSKKFNQNKTLRPKGSSKSTRRAYPDAKKDNFEDYIENINDALVDGALTDAQILKARSLRSQGCFTEAKQCLKEAMSHLQKEIEELAKIAANFEYAENQYENKNYKDALEIYKKIRDTCPEFVKAKIRFIETLSKTGNTKGALQAYDTLPKELAETSDLLYVKGLALCYDGQIEAAKKIWSEFMTSESSLALRTLNNQLKCQESGIKALLLNKYQDAIKYYTEGIEADPYNKYLSSLLYLERALAYRALKEYSKGLDDCTKAINLDGDYAKAYLIKAEMALNTNDFDKSIKYFRLAERKDAILGSQEKLKAVLEIKVLVQQGKKLYSSGEFDEALKCLEMASQLNKSNDGPKGIIKEILHVSSRYKNAENLYQKGDYESALEAYKEVRDICSDFAKAELRYIETLIKTGQTEEALRECESFPKEFSEDDYFFYLKGLALCYNGKTDAAIKVWNGLVTEEAMLAIRALKKQIKSMDEGSKALTQKNYEMAVNHFTQGIEADLYNKNFCLMFYVKRASAYQALKEYQKALIDCVKAIKLNVEYSKAYLIKGEIAMEIHDYEEAIESFSKAVEKDPNQEAKKKLKRARDESRKAEAKENHYETLGVTTKATGDELKRQYRKLSLQWHPDKNLEEIKQIAERKFKKINNAYTVLINLENKEEQPSPSSEHHPSNNFAQPPFNAYFQPNLNGFYRTNSFPQYHFNGFFQTNVPHHGTNGFGLFYYDPFNFPTR